MRKVAAIALAAMMLTACGGGSSGGSGAGGGGGAKVSLSKSLEGASKAPACQGSPVTGGTLVYARQQTTENLDTLKLVNGNGDIFASNLLFQGLTRPDPKGTPTVQPAVAEKWEVSS